MHSSILAQANVLNIFEDESNSEELRKRVANTELGRYHDYAIDATYWPSVWRQGLMMRYGSNHPDRKPVLEEMQRFAQEVNRGSRELKHIQAWIEAQNLTREWIELLGAEARNMGFDALIGCEIFSSSALGGRPCPVLFALTGKALTPPIWVK